MNTDRFLTRAWDPQEQRMIYPINMADVAYRQKKMQCTGFREDNRKDGKLAYEFDFIKDHTGNLFLIILKDGCWCAKLTRAKNIINMPFCDLAMLEGRFSVIGNKFENPELLLEEDK